MTDEETGADRPAEGQRRAKSKPEQDVAADAGTNASLSDTAPPKPETGAQQSAAEANAGIVSIGLRTEAYSVDPTRPQTVSESGHTLDEFGLPLSGPARARALADLGKPDPRVDPDAWATKEGAAQ